jgi:formylglycine-generating enzyme
MPATHCPTPLEDRPDGCSTEVRVAIDRTRIVVGPSDWEAEGRVAPRTIEAGPFWVDAFEATEAALGGHDKNDPLRAASGLSRDEAAAFCGKRGGRLPTEDEWMVAAAGAGGHRYPWGETGAVCARAAFGLATGPCSRSGIGPDSVGAHADGDSTRGVHDLAGNVAEWVAADPGRPSLGVAKGGSWRSALATELRVWARLEVDPAAHDDRVGVRCVYDAP